MLKRPFREKSLEFTSFLKKKRNSISRFRNFGKKNKKHAWEFDYLYFLRLAFPVKNKGKNQQAEKNFENSATIAENCLFGFYFGFDSKWSILKSFKGFFLVFQRFRISIIVNVPPFVSSKNRYEGKTMEVVFFWSSSKITF